MSQSEARSWWSDVEHLRESLERRRGVELSAVPVPADAAQSPPRPRSRFAAEPWLDGDVDTPEPGDDSGARTVDDWLEDDRPRRTGRFDRQPARDAAPALAIVPPSADPQAPEATPSPRLVAVDRRRPLRRPVDRVGPRPDRVALWAVMLAFFLVLVAALSSAQAAVG